MAGFRRSDPNPRVVGDTHGEMAIGATLTWDDVGCEATYILVERTPIWCAAYVAGDRWCVSARRIRA
jgi:hypothetical protein